MAETPDTEILDLTAGIVAAHVSNNPTPVDQIPSLIKEVHKTLLGLGSEAAEEKLTPAVPIKRSVKNEAITCLECGQQKKMLKRHLSTAHGLSVQDYRDKWKLASNYPMTAPNYAAQRSKLAKKIGLGKKPRGRGRKKS